MRMVAPRTGAPEITIAEEQEEYLPLTVALYCDEHGRRSFVLSRFTFTRDERAAIAAGEDIYIGLLTFGQPMQPLSVCVGPGAWTVPESIDRTMTDGG